MNTKQLKLLNYLSNQADTWTTSSQLALKLNVSLRSIKNYISEIKKINPALINSSKNGYQINISELRSFLKINESLTPQSPEERVDYIIIKLIKNSGENIDIYDLSSEIFISESTLKVDIQKVKRKCSKFNLSVIVFGDTITLEGLEKNKRKMMNTILYNQSGKNFMNIDTIQQAFPDYNVQEIQKIIFSTAEKHHYYINHYSLINMVLHVVITIDRLKNNYFSDYIDEQRKLLVKQHEYEIASLIVNKLEHIYNINYNENEIYELSLLIISNAVNVDYRNVNKLNLEELIGKDCMNLVNELIEDINEYYLLDFSESEFLVRFSLHIKKLLIRVKSEHYCKNPFYESIKSDCPLIYDCAVNISYKIKKYIHCEISEHEIAYIALHIGAALVNQKDIQSKITCAIYFPEHYDLDVKLAESLSEAFSDSLFIKYIVNNENDLHDLDIDLIISTVANVNITDVPIAVINLFFIEKDRKIISSKINIVKRNKQRLKFKAQLQELFNPSLFIKNINFENEFQAIEFMCNKMESYGYVNKLFKDEVIQREVMSSTAFNGIAIPHSMNTSAIKTGMFAIVNSNGIRWGSKQVNVIFLLTINKEEKLIFNEMFDLLTTILSEESNLKNLIMCNSFNEFISTLVDSI